MRLFVFGFGYSARAVVQRMRPRLDAAWGTTREPSAAPDVRELKLLHFDGRKHSAAVASALADADHVLVSAPPDMQGDPALAQHHAELAAARPRSLVYLSTVGVYGDHGGGWVDETSECRPVSKRSVERLEAEAEWVRFGDEVGTPVAIVRLGGIYGPGRGPFEKIRSGTARRILKPGQVFNRIHVEDIAAIVDAAFERRASGVFNGVDDEPAPPEDVLSHAAKLLGVLPPPAIPFDTAALSPMARSFYGENKRVRNDRMKRELGVRLACPTYREGLAAILAAEAAPSPKAPAISS